MTPECNRNLSFTIKCLRALVFDSSIEHGSTFILGMKSEESFSFSRPAEIWGDVCIDFYQHKTASVDSPRKHLFFLTFHTAFYVGKGELSFSKKKLDKLCKDTKNKKCDQDFGLKLCFKRPEDSSLENERIGSLGFKRLMKQYGSFVRYLPGDTVLEMNSHEVSLLVKDLRIVAYVHCFRRSLCYWSFEDVSRV